MKYQFEEQVAKDIGVEEAIMLSNIEFWVEKNASNEKHFYDDHFWTYNSQEAFQKMFFFWSRRQVQRILKKLEESRYIKSANYNKKGYDKTLWYTSIRAEFTEKMAQNNIAPNRSIESTIRCYLYQIVNQIVKLTLTLQLITKNQNYLN